MKIILAIDGGGSRTRCLAMSREGKILGAGAGAASNHLQVEKEIVRASLEQAIREALSGAKAKREDVVCVSAGLAGVDYDGAGRDEMEALLSELGFNQTVVNGDMIIAHAGALAGAAGVLALAGTGSCVLGIDAEGNRVKVGGWGPIYGDEGSAYRIGQTALRRAARDADGRGEKTALRAAILKEFGIDDFQRTIDCVYLKGLEPRDIAALCRTAYLVAEAGDSVAVEIFEQAGEELAESAAAAVRRLNLAEPTVSYQGAVLESCAIVRETMTRCLKNEFPAVEVVAPRFTPVTGAFLLGCQAVGWRPDATEFSQT